VRLVRSKYDVRTCLRCAPPSNRIAISLVTTIRRYESTSAERRFPCRTATKYALVEGGVVCVCVCVCVWVCVCMCEKRGGQVRHVVSGGIWHVQTRRCKSTAHMFESCHERRYSHLTRVLHLGAQLNFILCTAVVPSLLSSVERPTSVHNLAVTLTRKKCLLPLCRNRRIL
jgi:hypothetical protein